MFLLSLWQEQCVRLAEHPCLHANCSDILSVRVVWIYAVKDEPTCFHIAAIQQTDKTLMTTKRSVKRRRFLRGQ